MNKTIHYITYQTFPANTANSIQSISNIKKGFRKGHKAAISWAEKNIKVRI